MPLTAACLTLKKWRLKRTVGNTVFRSGGCYNGGKKSWETIAVIFESVEDQTLADFVLKLAQDRRETESNNHSIRRWNLVKCLLVLIALRHSGALPTSPERYGIVR